MDISESQLSKHIMLIGAIGTGKTNCFYFLIQNLDMRMTASDIMILFDTKGDFYEKFYKNNVDYLIGNSWEFRDKTSYWNIFREIEYGGRTRAEKELTAKEIAKSLFEDRKNSSQPFFTIAACDIFGKLLLYKMRQFWNLPEYRELEQELERETTDSEKVMSLTQRQRELFDAHAHELNNKVLTEDILQKYEIKDYREMLESKENPDFKSALSYIGDGKSNQALGVLGEMNSMASDYFIGVFAQYAPGRDISMREIIRNKGGRKLYIEYDLSVGQALCSIYRLLVDLGLKEALGRQRSEGNVYLIIDEFKLLPKLSHIDDALNFGRSLGIKAAVGIQNIRQLEDVYGETKGQVIAAGFSNIFAFRMTDGPSRQYISELFGRNYLSIGHWDEVDRYHPDNLREGHTVEDWQLMELEVGEAVVGLSGLKPFYFSFEEYGG